ncbi:MAG: DUF2062 domain-containing protein [Opitutus sp.]|nr:DUF2062 domain-containing protein [Opitutus sp.]
MADPIRTQLTQGVTPEKLALTLGLGLACGVFPFLGFTTALCFVAALALRLNQPIIQILNQLLWPVQLAGIPLFVALGQMLYGAAPVPVDPPEIARIFTEAPREFWTRFGLMGLHALTAWLLVAPVLVATCYFAFRPLLRKLAPVAAVDHQLRPKRSDIPS